MLNKNLNFYNNIVDLLDYGGLRPLIFSQAI